MKKLNKIFSWLLILVVSISTLQYSTFAKEKDNKTPSNGILVKYKSNSDIAKVKSDTKKAKGLKNLKTKNITKKMINNLELWNFDESVDQDQLIEELNLNPDIEYAEPNYIVHTTSQISDKVLTGNIPDLQSNIQSTGTQTVSNDIVIAVIDTGIDISHPDLISNIFTNMVESKGEIPNDGIDNNNNGQIDEDPDDGIDNDGNGYIDDVNGWDYFNNDNSAFDDNDHGTHVSGIITSAIKSKETTNSSSYKLMPLKFIGSNGSGYDSDAIEAIEYAEEMGASVVNCSWGGYDYTQALADAISNSNMLFVCAAGNESSNTDYNNMYPAGFGFSNMISVAAVDAQGVLASFSNYGTNVDVAALGVNVESTVPGGGYETMSGTSMAAPFVTGTASLVKKNVSGLNNIGIKGLIKERVISQVGLRDKVSSRGIVNIDRTFSSNCSIYEGERYGAGSVSVYGKIYTVGGYARDQYVSTLEVYTPTLNSWERKPSMTNPRAHAGVVSVNNKIYVFGGYNGSILNSVEIYNLAPDTWQAATPMPQATYGMGIVVVGNYIYTIGGYTNSGYTNIVYMYDTINNTWTQKANLPIADAFLSAVTTDSNTIYTFGGSNLSGILNKTYKYNISSNTWTEMADMQSKKSNAPAVVVNNKVYVIGGSNNVLLDGKDNVFSDNRLLFDSYSTTVNKYDVATNTWGKIEDISVVGKGYNSVNVNGDIYIVGGWNAGWINNVIKYIGGYH